MSDSIFSVIITAYNQPQDIKRAVESVLNQTVKCFEIIVVDDCSTDETPEVLTSLAESNSNVKIIRHEKNSSSHVARCTGVENASGQYVIFLDGDDYLFPDALEKLLKQVVEPLHNDFDVCEYSYMCQPTHEICKPAKWDNSKPRIDFYLNHDAPVTVWNKLYKTEVVKKAFSLMDKAYIRCGDDTYETICIAYNTKKFIQKDILVTNYQLENGISLRKNTFESNLRHCESLKTSLNCLRTFFENTDYKNTDALVKIVEQRFFDWILSVMENNTEIEDIVSSLVLLPKYFSNNIVVNIFKPLYSKKIFKKRIKQRIKSFFI